MHISGVLCVQKHIQEALGYLQNLTVVAVLGHAVAPQSKSEVL